MYHLTLCDCRSIVYNDVMPAKGCCIGFSWWWWSAYRQCICITKAIVWHATVDGGRWQQRTAGGECKQHPNCHWNCDNPKVYSVTAFQRFIVCWGNGVCVWQHCNSLLRAVVIWTSRRSSLSSALVAHRHYHCHCHLPCSKLVHPVTGLCLLQEWFSCGNNRITFHERKIKIIVIGNIELYV